MSETRTTASIQAEIDTLRSVEYLVGTNSGTFGATEACRKCGTGDPRFATRNIYETVGGSRRETGPDETDAPGYMRRINAESLSADRRRLTDLLRQARR